MGNNPSTPASSPPVAAATAATTPPPLIDATTIFSLLSTVAILATAYGASLKLLPARSTTKIRILFIWHAFDALVHFILEGSFLAQCFFVYRELPTSFSAYASKQIASQLPTFIPTPPDVYWLGDKTRMYGAFYGNNLFAKLWQEYAKADRRWGGTDLTVISLELLTVFIGAPLCLWVCSFLVKGEVGNRKWFWMSVIATGELYGGFMTFAPEWLSGSPNLDTSNWMYTWVYLFFFNTLWVWIPLWIMYESYQNITASLSQVEIVNLVDFIGKKDD